MKLIWDTFSFSAKPYLPIDMLELELDETADAPTQQPPPPQTYLLHSINSALLIRQLPSQGISFQLWPAAAVLVALLDGQTESAALSSLLTASRRLRVLELGSGTGLVGIAAAALLGARVTVTDLPHVLPNLQLNVDANAGVVMAHGGEVHVAAMSWGEAAEMEAVGREFDVILGSDVVYHDNLYGPLLETLKFLLLGRTSEGEEREVVFFMAHLKRWKKESAFFNKAHKYFHVEVVQRDSPLTGDRVGIKVYRFARKQLTSK